MITKEQWVDWRQSHVTQEFLKILWENRQGRLEEISEGRVGDKELYIEIGRTQGIKDCVELAVTNFPYMEIESGPESGSV